MRRHAPVNHCSRLRYVVTRSFCPFNHAIRASLRTGDAGQVLTRRVKLRETALRNAIGTPFTVPVCRTGPQQPDSDPACQGCSFDCAASVLVRMLVAMRDQLVAVESLKVLLKRVTYQTQSSSPLSFEDRLCRLTNRALKDPRRLEEVLGPLPPDTRFSHLNMGKLHSFARAQLRVGRHPLPGRYSSEDWGGCTARS